MIQEQAVPAVIITLTSKKNKSRKNRKILYKILYKTLALKKKEGFYETLLAELRLEDEYNFNILL